MATQQAMARDMEFLARKQNLDEVERDKPRFISYVPALMAALLKDTLDLAIGWIPGVGFVLAVCFGALIFALLTLVKTNKQLVDSKFLVKRLLIILLAMLVESFPIFDFLPIETLTIVVIYLIDKHASAKLIALLTEGLKRMR